MKCPNCNSENYNCVDSRIRNDMRYRRYRCNQCDRRFSTVEVVMMPGQKVKDYAEIQKLISCKSKLQQQLQYYSELIDSLENLP